MFRKTIALSIFALLLAAASCRPQGDVNECSGRDNGLHADGSDNTAFFVCYNDQVIVHSKCDPGEVFDADTRTCSGGPEDQDLTAYSGNSELDDVTNRFGSQVSDLLDESLGFGQDARWPNPRPTARPPPSTPKPPTEQPDGPQSPYKNKIINVHVTENIFPKSILIIGRANREQKNK